jgi:hypothetical protein
MQTIKPRPALHGRGLSTYTAHRCDNNDDRATSTPPLQRAGRYFVNIIFFTIVTSPATIR